MAAPSPPATAAKSLFQNLKRFFKKPWEITGPCSDPEYRNAVPNAIDYRRFCPATYPAKACIPSSDPETVFDIKYYPRDQRRNRPPIRRTILTKADISPVSICSIALLRMETPLVAGTRNRTCAAYAMASCSCCSCSICGYVARCGLHDLQ
ncbi:hypothetical protein MRB53_005549 [Persea americana]|uniref:Uncharacterized protein n=1 Tax=Persea americana TaxID=3435 RepID=A0ACC2MDT5_PERAE|nr:hypothetical protein MRB53_005549 [Persea americana]